MKSGLQKSLAVLGSSVVLVIGFDYVTYAATGSSLILGKSNVAGTVTTITNTNPYGATGAALRLVTKNAGFPPFTTNAKGLVVNLFAARAANADKVGGFTAAQLIASGHSTRAITYADATGTHSGNVTFAVGTGVPAGNYLISLNAWVGLTTSGNISAAPPVVQYMRCYLHNSGSFTVLAEATSNALNGNYVSPSFAIVRTVTAGENFVLDCYSQTGDGWTSELPVTLSFVSLDGNTARSM